MKFKIVEDVSLSVDRIMDDNTGAFSFIVQELKEAVLMEIIEGIGLTQNIEIARLPINHYVPNYKEALKEFAERYKQKKIEKAEYFEI
jgi:hypothetical protein